MFDISKRCLLFSLIVVIITFVANEVNCSSNEEKLLRDLFTHYDRTVRPAPSGHTITVKLAYQVNQIDFDEKKGIFTASAHLIAEWDDPKLHWKPLDYGNTTKIHLTGHELWLPDISIYNSVGNKALDISDSGATWLDHTGLVMWSMKVRLQTLCELDMFRWPYDVHRCEIKLGSWTYDGFQLDLLPSDKLSPIQEFTRNPEFAITNITSKRETTFYDCCSEPYVTLEYTIDFARRSSTFAAVFVIPALSVVVMTLSAFWLPPHRGEKILLNGITLIMVTMYIIYFIRNLPCFSLRIPLIAIFYCLSFVLVSLSLIISVLVLASARSKCKGHMPPGLRKILKSRVAILLGPKEDNKKQDQTELTQNFEDSKSHETHSLISASNNDDEWTSLGIILDRVSFIVYSIVFTLTGLVSII